MFACFLLIDHHCLTPELWTMTSCSLFHLSWGLWAVTIIAVLYIFFHYSENGLPVFGFRTLSACLLDVLWCIFATWLKRIVLSYENWTLCFCTSQLTFCYCQHIWKGIFSVFHIFRVWVVVAHSIFNMFELPVCSHIAVRCFLIS